MRRYIPVIFLLVASVFLVTSEAFSQDKGDDFMLLIYGKNIYETEVSTDLMENPGLSNEWVSVGGERDVLSLNIGGDKNLYVIPDLSTNRFVGQDIRENYIALRIENKQQKSDRVPVFRGAWALKQSGNVSPHHLKHWGRWIIHDPLKMRNAAFASIVYPQNRELPPNEPLIEHIELPVRHLKAGVQEVRWLEILFSGTH